MDYTSAGNRYFTVLTQSDCLRLSEFDFDCFDIFFTSKEWNAITEIAIQGYAFFHRDPTAPQFMKYAIESTESLNKVYETLSSLRFAHEQRMIDNNWPFPK